MASFWHTSIDGACYLVSDTNNKNLPWFVVVNSKSENGFFKFSFNLPQFRDKIFNISADNLEEAKKEALKKYWNILHEMMDELVEVMK